MENTILSLWRQRVQAQISIAEPTCQRTTPPLLHLLSPGLWTHPQTAQPWHPCSPVKLMQLTRLTLSLLSLLWKNYTGFSNTILWSFSRNRQWNGVSREGRVLFSSIAAEIFKHLVLEPQRCLTDSPHTCWRVELLVSCIYMWQNVLFSSHTVHSLGLTLHMCRLLIYRYSLSHSEQFRQREREVDLLQESEHLHLAASTGHISRKLLKYMLLSSFLRRGGTEQKQKIHIVQYRPAVPNK